MGRRAVREKKTKTITRTTGKTAERSIKRDQLDLIASICGTTRDTTGEVQRYATSTNQYDDGAAADERASESTTTVDSEPSNTTV